MLASEVTYIGSLPIVQMQFLLKSAAGVGSNVVSKTFKRWRSTEVEPIYRQMLKDRSDFIVDQYPLRRAWDNGKRLGQVLLRRHGALGDIVVLYPAVREIKRHLPFKFSLMCSPAYTQLFDCDDTFTHVYPTGAAHHPVDVNISLDGVLERDLAWVDELQAPDPRFLVPRVHAYYDFLGEGFLLPETFTPDYSLNTQEQDKVWAESIVTEIVAQAGDRPRVAVQARGSGSVRSIGRDRTIQLTRQLSKDFNVIVVDRDMQYTWKDWDAGIFAVYNRPLLNIVELLKRCAAAVVTDSGMQWLSHIAATPMVSILGPTRWTEKVVTHPLYAVGRVGWVDTAELYKCAVCYENAFRCKWQYSCLNKLDIGVLSDAVQAQLIKVTNNGH